MTQPGELAAGKHEQVGDVSGDQAHGAHGMELEQGTVPSSPGFIGVFQLVGQQALVAPFPERYTPSAALSIARLLGDWKIPKPKPHSAMRHPSSR